MKLQVVDLAGQAQQSIDVEDAVFGIEPNQAVVHQTLVAQLAARRAGTHSTKTRGQVEGSTAKIRRQKGLGMARQGSIRSPFTVVVVSSSAPRRVTTPSDCRSACVASPSAPCSRRALPSRV